MKIECRLKRFFASRQAVLAAAMLLSPLLLARSVSADQNPPALLLVRLIEVSEDEEQQEDRRLHDLLPMLRRNLRYRSYRLAGQRRFPPQAGRAESVGAGFIVAIEDISGATITVSLRYRQADSAASDRELLHTRLRLQRDRPVIVGPFRDERGGEYIVVFSS